ncbi:MAG: hypothetical protein KGQ78_03850 [Acidobacteria bacterium]|nr:hypothetical protein [Acidobacteriota bacterium]
MRFTRAVMVFVALFYVFLWVLDLNGMTSLTPVLVVPAVLAVLVAFGVWLNNFMGITPRSPKFVEPEAAAAPAPSSTQGPTPTDVDAPSPPKATPRDPGSSDGSAHPRVDPHGGPPA